MLTRISKLEEIDYAMSDPKTVFFSVSRKMNYNIQNGTYGKATQCQEIPNIRLAMYGLYR